MTEIQTLAKLSQQDMCELSIIVDLMSRLRSCPSKTSKTFGDLITHALSFPLEFDIINLHVVTDSNIEDSTKSAERARRAGGKEITEYCEGDITEDVPLPSDME